MNAFFEKLSKSGIKIYLKKGKLKYRALPGVMDQRKKDWIREYKQSLLEFIKHNTAKVYSEVFKEEVHFIRSQKYASLLPPGSSSYTLEELRRLLEKNPPPSLIKQVHKAKENFSGEVI